MTQAVWPECRPACFPRPAAPAKEVGVTVPVICDLITQNRGNVVLSENFGKPGRPPFAVKSFIQARSPFLSDRAKIQGHTPFCRKRPTRGNRAARLRTGIPAAHPRHRLMLLGSPPDMVHGRELRRTHPSTLRRTARTARAAPSKKAYPPL